MVAKHPSSLRIEDYSYELPDERIARNPLLERDTSKLLIYKGKAITESIYRDLAHYLPAGSLLVLNNTRVVEARLLFTKPTGATIEIFLLEPESNGNIEKALQRKAQVRWKCLVGGAGKWKHGQEMSMIKAHDGAETSLKAKIVDKNAHSFTIEFSWQPEDLSFSEVLHRTGQMPIPPYLKRASTLEDTSRYQTIYNQREGSVAAPTAGLHFTPSLLESLENNGIKPAYLTLHVGAGTFLPVKSEEMAGHQMHGEFIEFDRGITQTLLDVKGEVFAVGTTSLRTLESMYWLGVKVAINPGISITDLHIGQWEVYDELLEREIPVKESLQALLRWMQLNQLDSLMSRTEILIAPPYKPRMVSGLITNFHQPKSTLLLLVAALIGEDWRRIYRYALDHDFRFLSYGDGCLLFVD